VYSEKIPDVRQRKCPKHVEFYSKNKFEKLVHLVGFFIGRRTSTTTSIYSPYKNIYIDSMICIYREWRTPKVVILEKYRNIN